ncbi:MAG: YceG family protein [Bacillota bacterium]|nr:YceG family protein [Bacillota bacterium]
MYLSYNQLKIHQVSLSFENWLGVLKKPIPERSEFLLENGIIQIGQVLGEFLGVPLDVDEYYNQLYDFIHAHDLNIQLLSEDSLDKTIQNQHFQSVQKVLNIYHEQKLSINRFTAFLDGEMLLLRPKNTVLFRKAREAMILTLELFSQKESSGLANTELRRVLVDIVKWSINHLDPVLKEADPMREMPKFLWYGDFKKSHQYFLYYLIKLGCDVIVFHPEAKDVLTEMISEKIFIYHFPNQEAAEPFPKEKRSRKMTVAYRASKEIDTILHQDGMGLYKPWQFRDYTPTSITLKTTYDELFILGKELAMIRPDFNVGNGIITVPVLFAKVHGVSRNRKEYWDRLHAFSQLENGLLIRQFPLTGNISNDFRFHFRNALGRDGLLDPEKIMKAHYWSYSHLPAGLQIGLAHAIRRLCERPKIRRLANENDEEVKIFLFSHSMQIPKSIIQLLEKFDYSQHVPKLVLYINEQNGHLSRSDAALLLLLNNFGIDIIIYNPSGHNDIENYIELDSFDTHWLEDVVFEQEFKEPSILKKVLFQGILKNFKGD